METDILKFHPNFHCTARLSAFLKAFLWAFSCVALFWLDLGANTKVPSQIPAPKTFCKQKVQVQLCMPRKLKVPAFFSLYYGYAPIKPWKAWCPKKAMFTPATCVIPSVQWQSCPRSDCRENWDIQNPWLLHGMIVCLLGPSTCHTRLRQVRNGSWSLSIHAAPESNPPVPGTKNKQAIAWQQVTGAFRSILQSLLPRIQQCVFNVCFKMLVCVQYMSSKILHVWPQKLCILQHLCPMQKLSKTPLFAKPLLF